MKHRAMAALALGVTLTVIAGAAPVAAEQRVETDWRRVATPNDRTRLRGWRDSWSTAVAAVQAGGGGAALARDPALFDPDGAVPHAEVPVGAYRCRTARMAPRGGAAGKPVDLGAWTPCTVVIDGAATRFATTGRQRTEGTLFTDTDARAIFLGTLVLADERRPMRYGRDAHRDMAGIVERIGARRWRIVLPQPGFGSTLDLIEVAGT